MKIRRNVASPGRATPTGTCLGIAAICSMALWTSAGPALASPEQDPLVVGDASAIEAGVEVRGGADAPFVLLEAVEPVAVGDGVRTDTTGFAEIAYFDGSRTRLDIDTEFEVVELVNDAGVSSTRTSMGVGRTWHRVESLGEGEFTVETSQATATVRGTAFVLACAAADRCTYLVFEGIVDLTLADGSVVEVIGPAEVEVVGGVAGPLTPVTLDRLLGDPWLLDNANRDIAAGFADLVAVLGESEATTTMDLSTTSTTTADTSTTTTATATTELPTSTTEASTSTTETASTTLDPATPTTTEVANEPSTTTTVRPTEPTAPTGPTTTTTTTTVRPTEPTEPTGPTTTTTTTTTTTVRPTEPTEPTGPTTTTSTTTTTIEEATPTSTTSTTSSTTSTTSSTTSTTTSTTSTTQPATTTTTLPPRGVPICHWVGVNTYRYEVVSLLQAIWHLLAHDNDYVPWWSGSCSSEATAAATITSTSLPPSTTTTTAPTETELVTVAAQPVVEAAPPDTTAPNVPPKVARTPPVAPSTTATITETTVAVEPTVEVETTEMTDTSVAAEPFAMVDTPEPVEPEAVEGPAPTLVS